MSLPNGIAALPLSLVALSLVQCGGGGKGGGTGPTGNACTEDASTSIMVIVEPASTSNRSSACGIVKPELESRMATVRFVNTHPTRRIAIAAILINESNKQSFPLGPCAFSVQQGGFSSLAACHEGSTTDDP